MEVQWPEVLHLEYNSRICNASFNNIRSAIAFHCTDSMAIPGAAFAVAATHTPYARRPGKEVEAPSEASTIFDLSLGHTLFPNVPVNLKHSSCSVCQVERTAVTVETSQDQELITSNDIDSDYVNSPVDL